jgi:hypothetical protein
LHDDGKTGGTLNSWGQYAKSGDIIFDVAGGGLGGSVVGKVAGRAIKSGIKNSTPFFIHSRFVYICVYPVLGFFRVNFKSKSIFCP